MCENLAELSLNSMFQLTFGARIESAFGTSNKKMPYFFQNNNKNNEVF